MIDRAIRRARSLQLARAALNMLAFPFLAVGWTAGKIAFVVKFLAALLVEGFLVAYRGDRP